MRIAIARLLPAALTAAFLAGCSASGPSKAPGAFPAVNPGGTPHAQYVVVGDDGNDSLLTYNLGTGSTIVAGNLAPAYDNHSATLKGPFFIFNDFNSNLWAANFYNASLTWYSVSGTGATPTAHTISGSNTTLGNPTGVYISANGTIYVADRDSTRGYATVDEFAPGSSGNVAPVAWIGGPSTTLSGVQGLSIDSSGNLWVINFGTLGVDEFSSSLSAGQNNVAPTAAITSTALGEPVEMYIDRQSHIWVGDLSAAVTGLPALFEFNANGGAQTPICTISGSNTGLDAAGGQTSVAVDNGGYVYAVNNASPIIDIFAKGQCGNVTPAYTISGAATGLSAPAGVVVYSTSNDY
ncbi:MAG: hypothetical protein ACREMP_03090 [Candidatus Tyrphobacter sp.]